MNITSMLFAEFNLYSIALLAMLFFWFRRGTDNSVSSRWYTLVLLGFLVTFVFNLVWALVGAFSTPQNYHIGLRYFLKIMFFVFLNLSVFCWVGYSETELGNREFNDREQLKVILLPLIFMMVMVCTTGYTRIVFSIDSTGEYHTGYMYEAQMALLSFYTGVTGIRMLIKAEYESDLTKKSRMRQIGSFPVSIILAWVLSMILGDEFPVISPCVTIWLLFIHIGSTSEMVSTDKLTQIHNRQNLITYVTSKIRNHEDRLFLLMMDIDYFKRINDTFGHQEGDQALIRMANALKSAVQSMKRRPYLARYGGDEFIIVVEAEHKSEIDALCVEIQKKLDYYNAWSEKKYNMSVSIGVAEWEEGMNQKALIEAADQVLYNVKKEHHKKLDAMEA